MKTHVFTREIINILRKHFDNDILEIYKNSELIQYINYKTNSANKDSKSRGCFGNLYAIYVLVEDYINKGFFDNNGYTDYKGSSFSSLLKRQRELPFGAKLQNHALNQRMNQEFKKYFSTCKHIPIIRDVDTKKYWINENLIKISINNKILDLSRAIIEILDKYIDIKRNNFDNFISICEDLKKNNNSQDSKDFILNQLKPNVDARIFEIISYSILKYFYLTQSIFWGHSYEQVKEEKLKLYKTGRTNANDGGIDFVLMPIGRFFQVTETTDLKKYFLDIDKVQKFPITFVVKSKSPVRSILKKIIKNAREQYSSIDVIKKYISCIEEIINITKLESKLEVIDKTGEIQNIFDEIIKQSKTEFNYEDIST